MSTVGVGRRWWLSIDPGWRGELTEFGHAITNLSDEWRHGLERYSPIHDDTAVGPWLRSLWNSGDVCRQGKSLAYWGVGW